MAIKILQLKSVEEVLCSSNTPMASGDLVRLALNVSADSALPQDIEGIVQPPVERVRMMGDHCVVMGYLYHVAYDSDDLNAALDELTPDMVSSFGCISCCERISRAVQTLSDAVTPLQLQTPPLDESYRLQTVFAGGNNDLVFTWDGTGGILPSVSFIFATNQGAPGTPAAGGFSYNAALRRITVRVGNNGNAIAWTANQVLGSIGAALASSGISVALAAGNDGTGNVGLMALTPFTVVGTPAVRVGQLAIVTVTNGGRTYQDPWTATQIRPTRWAHPPGLARDRGQDNRLMRYYIDTDNASAWEPAYP